MNHRYLIKLWENCDNNIDWFGYLQQYIIISEEYLHKYIIISEEYLHKYIIIYEEYF